MLVRDCEFKIGSQELLFLNVKFLVELQTPILAHVQVLEEVVQQVSYVRVVKLVYFDRGL